MDIPKPLFPVAGKPIIQHHIEACRRVKNLKEILILGFYEEREIQPFVASMQVLYDDMKIRYLHEYSPLGTAGGIYHFRDQIRAGNPSGFFVLNGDVCADFPLQELYDFHASKGERALITIMTTEATKQQSLDYGNLVLDSDNGVTHFVEKPSSYVSHLINCGVYVVSMDIFTKMSEVFYAKQEEYFNSFEESPRDRAHMLWEREILTPLAGTGRMFSLQVNNWWSQTKTAASAIYANRHYLGLYKHFHPERLANPGFKNAEDSNGSLICNIIPDVHIHPTASVHPTAVVSTYRMKDCFIRSLFLIYHQLLNFSLDRTCQLARML
jgi:mannose-1-phosphate guanylyltransferase